MTLCEFLAITRDVSTLRFIVMKRFFLLRLVFALLNAHQYWPHLTFYEPVAGKEANSRGIFLCTVNASFLAFVKSSELISTPSVSTVSIQDFCVHFEWTVCEGAILAQKESPVVYSPYQYETSFLMSPPVFFCVFATFQSRMEVNLRTLSRLPSQ